MFVKVLLTVHVRRILTYLLVSAALGNGAPGSHSRLGNGFAPDRYILGQREIQRIIYDNGLGVERVQQLQL